MRFDTLRQACQSKRAFTLIEVLVVVAIIALLVAILLPSLTQARALSQRSACAANVHQIGIALNMYTTTYGYYPGHHLLNPTAQHHILWPVRLLRSMSGSGRSASQHQVYSCPSSKYKKRWDGHQRIWYSATLGPPLPTDCFSFDYGYNDWGTGETNDPNDPKPNLGLGGHIVTNASDKTNRILGEVRVEKVKRPADMIAIADNDADDVYKGRPGEWDTAIDPIDDANREWPGARHSKGANVLWADGHATHNLQSKLVEKSLRARRRWNNDFRAHCDRWGDKGGFTCPAYENIFSW